MSDGTLPKGEFKQNARGFYHFYPAPGQGLSAHDCRRVAAWLKAHNAAGSTSDAKVDVQLPVHHTVPII